MTDFEAAVHVLCLKVLDQSFAYDASSEPEDFKVQNPKSEHLNSGLGFVNVVVTHCMQIWSLDRLNL